MPITGASVGATALGAGLAGTAAAAAFRLRSRLMNAPEAEEQVDSAEEAEVPNGDSGN